MHKSFHTEIGIQELSKVGLPQLRIMHLEDTN